MLRQILRSTGPCVLIFAASPAAQTQPESQAPPKAMATIGKRELLRHATFLSCDDLQGRRTGSPGQAAAAEYIKNHFTKLGLEPLGDEVHGDANGSQLRSFLQLYPIQRTLLKASELRFGATKLKHGYAVLGARERNLDTRAKLQFVGLGRTQGARSDLAEAERLEGKIAVVLIKPPKGEIPAGLGIEQTSGMCFTVLRRIGRTARILGQRGAEAILFVQTEDKIGLSEELNYLALSPGKAMVTANFPDADPGLGNRMSKPGPGSVPTMVLSVAASKAVLRELAVKPGQVAEYFAGDRRMCAAKSDVDASLRLEIVHEGDARASNVVALLRGSDPELREQAIVYSAHMDHVGMRMDGEVFNGADDNASGAAGLLAIASAYAKERPRRSIIFLSVSGEELGLWGSQFYVDHATWPLDKIVANINTDGLGRSGCEAGPDEITVTPSYRHGNYSTVVRDAVGFARQLGVTFTSGDKYYTRSDHYHFAKKGIPVVFFCSGEHEDYHQVSDTVDKLDGAKMERMARLAFWTGWHVASTDTLPYSLGMQRNW